MNLLLFEASELEGDRLLLAPGRRLEHLLAILKSAAGDTLRIGEINGLCGTATVESIDTSGAVLRITALETRPPPALDLVLVLALPRPKMLRRILRAVAEVGIKELHLLNTARVEKSFWQSPLLQEARLREYLLAGLEQTGDTHVPAVHLHQRFRPFAEDLLPALCAQRNALLATPGADLPCPATPPTPGLLAIGPEGGFVAFEEALLEVAGCRPVSLGQRVLRVETALQASLGRYLG